MRCVRAPAPPTARSSSRSTPTSTPKPITSRSGSLAVRAERRRRGEATTGAILFRSKKHMVRFGDALGRRGIPHRILGLGGLLSTPEVVDVVSALRVISDPPPGRR